MPITDNTRKTIWTGIVGNRFAMCKTEFVAERNENMTATLLAKVQMAQDITTQK